MSVRGVGVTSVGLRDGRSSPATAVVAVPVSLFVIVCLITLSVVRVADYDEAIFLDVAQAIREEGLPIRNIAPDGVFFFNHTPLYSYTLAAVSWAGETPSVSSH